MKYRELLALYKEGKLEDEKRKEVEADIEKQDAIGEYLYEESEIPDFDDLSHDDGSVEVNGEDEKFAAMIRKSIHDTFVKMGITICGVALMVTLLAVYLLPIAVSQFFYNPAKEVASRPIEGTNGCGFTYTQQMSVDLSVYSSLVLPCQYRNIAGVESEGYGVYSFSIPQTSSVDGYFSTVSGKLVRNKLTLYTPDVLDPTPHNAFVIPGVYDNDPNFAAGVDAKSFEKFAKLNDDDWYRAYISLGELTDYEDFYNWFKAKGMMYNTLWCGVYTEDEDGYSGITPIGFSPSPSGMALDWDREKYPNLCLLDATPSEEVPTSDALTTTFTPADDFDAMKTHFLSMLRYYSDNIEAMNIFNSIGADYVSHIESRIEWVEKNGLQLYGFAILAKKDALIELSQDNAVSYIFIEPLR